MTHQELLNANAKLTAENAALKAAPARRLTLKVSQKGALSIYGMGRFPLTLYKEQWTKVLAAKSEIESFIVANDSALKAKGDAIESPVVA